MVGNLRLLLIALAPIFSAALSPISVKGTKFYDDDGEQFFVKGVAYSRGAATLEDPLEDTSQCQIDAGFMNEAGINTIRVYYVEASIDHDGCMQAFASQGIYVWLDLTTPTSSFNRIAPEWTMDLFDHFSAVVDAFADYNNTLVLTVANEVINDDDLESSIAAPYIKAAARDIKAFRDARAYREIPIAYSSADLPFSQSVIADYFACGDDADSIDVFGLNTFSWCGNSSYQESGYDTLYEKLQNLNIPAVFTETGCNIVSPRTFDEVAVMLGSVFPAVFSGVIVYEWLQEANDYGLVQYPSNGSTGFPTTREDYDNLKSVFSTASLVSTAESDYKPSNSAPSCPTSDSSWLVGASATLPTIAALDLQTVTARGTNVDSEAASTSSASSTASGTAGGAQSAETVGSGGSESGMSSGAIAGIVVGCALIALGLVGGAFFLLRRRRRNRAAQQGQIPGGANTGEYSDKAELPGASAGQVRPKQELEAHSKGGYHSAVAHEMDSTGRKRQSRAYEMEGSSPHVEMEGSHGSQQTSSAATRVD